MNKTQILLYSGGVESSYLLGKLLDEKKKFIAVTIDNGLIPTYQKKLIQNVVNNFKINHTWIHFDYKKIPAMKKNLPARCYFCKREMFRLITVKYHCEKMVSGTSFEDPPRPGRMAEKEFNVATPLTHQRISRKKMMEFLTYHQIPFIENNTCLATRFPDYHTIREEEVKNLDKLETQLYEKLNQSLRLRKKEQFYLLEIKIDVLDKAANALNEIGILTDTLIKIRNF